MKSFDSDVKKYSEKIHLSVSERRALRERVVSYMEYHPLAKEEGASSYAFTEKYVLLSFNTFWTRIASGAALLLLIVGIPVAAERAVPGDVLYFVKTEVNESIQSQFADSPYEKIAFETKLIDRRIDEARLLASEGKLTKEVEASIAEDVKDHAEAAQDGLAELRTNDAEGAVIAEVTLGSALEVQSAVLDTNTSVSATSSIENILGAVNTAREEIEQNQSTTTSVTVLTSEIEEATTRAYELFETVKESATKEEERDINRRLSDIDRQIVAANKLRNRDEEAAVNELKEVLGLLQKLIVFMTDIDVSETVTLEALVPIVPTIEEHVASTRATLARVATTASIIEKRTSFVSDASVQEKVLLGLEAVAALSDDVLVRLSSEEPDMEGILKQLFEAEALVQDLEKMTLETIISDEESTKFPTPVIPGETSTSSSSTTIEATLPLPIFVAE